MSSFKFQAWPTEFRSINQYFGANPQNYAQFGLPGHEGIDIMAPTGSKVFSVAPGTVKMVQADPAGHNYGKHIRIEHADGYETIYAHLQDVSVRAGQAVEAGSLLGTADNTGNSFGSHLHLTLKHRGETQGNWPGNIVDPTPFLLPLLGVQRPAGPFTNGWAYRDGVFVINDLAQANTGGINLRETPSVNGKLIDLVPGGTVMVITGPARGQYLPVQVPTAALSNSVPTPPLPKPQPGSDSDNELVDGWAFASYLTPSGNKAVVGQYGINLRAAPQRTGQNIGLVAGGSTIEVTGAQQGEYLPVRVHVNQFSGPVNIPDRVTPPTPPPAPTPDSILGWAWSGNLSVQGNEAISGRFGTNLRATPARTGAKLGTLREGARAQVAGKVKGEFTPVRAAKADISDLPAVLPPVEQPEGATQPTEPLPPLIPVHDTTPGWAFTSGIVVSGTTAVTGPYGLNLRDAPRRNANNIGFVPGNAHITVTGAAQGEYTPVRVDDKILQPPFGSGAPSPSPNPPLNPDPEPMGHAEIGLHASADPDIYDDEVQEFADTRPGMIKLLSFHNPNGIRKLTAQHPDAKWVVRAFLDFGGRNISPRQFLNDTLSDMQRTLNLLQGKKVVIELHNEPNLRPEGLFSSWADGAAFARWWLELHQLYKQALPGYRYIYPGLSPGGAVADFKHDHIQFIEASRAAVEAADGLGVHLYWSNIYPMQRSLDVLDDYIARFRYKPIYVTEASNNKGGTPAHMKGRQYIEFWQELQKRPTVQGVTYFVASASNPAFKEEVWVGRGIGKVVGRR
ncbi:MAG: M23 family metallopeptidase [Chloroflexota bacterium]